MLKKTAVALAIATLTTTGCASIISKSSYPVAITSSPENASFIVTNEAGQKIHSGKTPTTLTLEASDGFFSSAQYNVKFKKKGYEDQNISIVPTLDGWYVANILFGGLPGLLIVDPLTGAMFKLPETANANLSAKGKASLENNKLTIMSLDDVHPNQRKNLVRVN